LRGRSIEAGAAHAAFKVDIDAVLARHAGALSAIEMLAIASQVVGMLVAYQDQRTVTLDMALETVNQNIEVGNALAIEGTLGKTEGRA
jgi:hypothetical protein